jgi:hypothetical protein
VSIIAALRFNGVMDEVTNDAAAYARSGDPPGRNVE